MILGLRTKNKKGPSVRLDYQIHVQEVKPWLPSESLRNLCSVLIQWEHGDRNSGSTNPVVPSLGSGIGDGKIEFNESFMLPVKLLREMSTKGGDSDTFQKNCLEFSLYELRKDKTVRGQLLGTAIVDLADYGVVKETLHSIENGHTSSSSGGDLSKEASSDRNRRESVSVLMQEEYAAEAEPESNTDDDDDDVFSQISLEVSSSAIETYEVLCPHSEEKGLQTVNDSPGEAYDQHHLPSNQELAKLETEPGNELRGNLKVCLSCSSSTDLSSNIGSLENVLATLSNPPDTSITSIPREENTDMRSKDYDHLMQEVEEKVADAGSERYAMPCKDLRETNPIVHQPGWPLQVAKWTKS